jgi:hypothetical protein
MDDAACPQPGCDLAAEILDRTLIASTDARVEHVRVVCSRGHRFLMPTQTLPDQPYGWFRAGSDRNARTRRGIQMKMKVIGVVAAAATTMGIVASAPAYADPVNSPHTFGVTGTSTAVCDNGESYQIMGLEGDWTPIFDKTSNSMLILVAVQGRVVITDASGAVILDEPENYSKLHTDRDGRLTTCIVTTDEHVPESPFGPLDVHVDSVATVMVTPAS